MENDLLERAADLVMDAGQTLLENGGEECATVQILDKTNRQAPLGLWN